MFGQNHKVAILFVVGLCCCSVGNAQIANWTGGGDGVSYSDPLNWDIGVVPLNGGGANYNVIVGNGQSIDFDEPGTISGISYGTSGAIVVPVGVQFEIDSVCSLG